MKTIIYAILYVIVTPFWWFVMQIDNVLSKLYMHISIKFMESSWQDDTKEAQILSFYESLPHVGIFEPKDYRHFTTKYHKTWQRLDW